MSLLVDLEDYGIYEEIDATSSFLEIESRIQQIYRILSNFDFISFCFIM